MEKNVLGKKEPKVVTSVVLNDGSENSDESEVSYMSDVQYKRQRSIAAETGERWISQQKGRTDYTYLQVLSIRTRYEL